MSLWWFVLFFILNHLFTYPQECGAEMTLKTRDQIEHEFWLRYESVDMNVVTTRLSAYITGNIQILRNICTAVLEQDLVATEYYNDAMIIEGNVFFKTKLMTSLYGDESSFMAGDRPSNLLRTYTSIQSHLLACPVGNDNDPDVYYIHESVLGHDTDERKYYYVLKEDPKDDYNIFFSYEVYIDANIEILVRDEKGQLSPPPPPPQNKNKRKMRSVNRIVYKSGKK